MELERTNTCPRCKSNNIKYSELIVDDGIHDTGVHYNAVCQDCQSTWKEHFEVTFGGVYDVKKSKEVQR